MRTSYPRLHPFDPLVGDEIRRASQLIRCKYPENAALDFRSISLYEPEKADMIHFLEAEHSRKALNGLYPDRQARVVYYLGSEMYLHEAIVDLDKDLLLENARLPKGSFANMTTEDATAVIGKCLHHPEVIKEIERLQISLEGVVCEPWPYGSDKIDDGKRKYQCYMFTYDPKNPTNKDGNFYAFPLDFSPVFDAITLDLLEIMRLPLAPTGMEADIGGPLELQEPSEYLPELSELRQDVKPLHIVQPQGASFTTEGNLIKWQKWRFRVGFNFREGLVLHDVRIDGRSAFYRLALSDMFVPYADPRPPFNRKSAFDFGDVGAGFAANSLQLGCDCLGLIHYFDAVLNTSDGTPSYRSNVVCMHEQDDLIGWKHTTRTGRAIGVRSRVLILQTICTVANYEYIFLWIFDQAGGITVEIRATGIMSTQPITFDQSHDYPWGTVVHPGIAAPSHQHIFCLRIDPAVDGFKNQVVQADNVALKLDDDSDPNGVAFITQKTPLSKAGAYDSDPSQGRVWLIQNPGVQHPYTGRPVAWKIIPHNSQMLLAQPDSLHRSRAGFAEHQLHLTKYDRRELYVSGTCTNQSRTDDGVRRWSSRKESLDGDVVIWHSFGVTHIPRVEDFPVMPITKLTVKLEPSSFFTRNPSTDVPPSSQESTKSSACTQKPDSGCEKSIPIGKL